MTKYENWESTNICIKQISNEKCKGINMGRNWIQKDIYSYFALSQHQKQIELLSNDANVDTSINTTKVTIFHLNIRGIRTQENRLKKISAVQLELDRLEAIEGAIDIVALHETFVNDKKYLIGLFKNRRMIDWRHS